VTEHEAQRSQVQDRRRVLQRAKAKVWLAITLHNNPQLVAMRLHARKQAAAATATQTGGAIMTKADLGASADASVRRLRDAQGALLTDALLAPSAAQTANGQSPRRRDTMSARSS